MFEAATEENASTASERVSLLVLGHRVKSPFEVFQQLITCQRIIRRAWTRDESRVRSRTRFLCRKKEYGACCITADSDQGPELPAYSSLDRRD